MKKQATKISKVNDVTEANAPIIAGYKGGGKDGGAASAPKEASDSLHSTAYARIVDLLSEGEIYGPVHGTENALQDVYLDGTPVANADGTLNFSNVEIAFRTGTQTQEVLPGFPASENTIGVGIALTDKAPWVHSYSDTQLSAARVTLAVAGLSKTDTSSGDISGYRVEYAIDLSTDGGAYQEVLHAAFDGKTTQRYARSHRIDFPRAVTGWSIRVRRLTANANSNVIQDQTLIDSTTEIVDAKLRYPMSAVVGIKIDASQFQSIPQRAYRLRGRVIQVPANYDAQARSYAGVWDGTFKLSWTNNPAWIFYDLIRNDRYGLGDLVPANWVDKWGLYQIARYCDELVPDGLGNDEPRFTCNVYLQERADAYRVVQDLASVFRGMAYWSSGSVFGVADMPGDSVYTFTSANVIDGKFQYVGAALRTRYSVALVSWCDLSDMGRQKVEYVEDLEALARYGIRQIEVTAFGCTSRAQAHRVGKWMLLTSQRETRTVTFSVGLDACVVRPGSIIKVADQNLAGRRIGGRIHEATTRVVTVDAEIGVRAGDRLTVNLPGGVSETRVVSSAIGTIFSADMTQYTVDSTELTADILGLPGTVMNITVTTPFSVAPEAEAVWTLESEELSAQLFRVLSVARKDGITADISAVQHEPGKFDNVDFGTRLDNPPITVVPPGVQPPPADVRISSYSVIAQGIAHQTAVFTWKAADHAVAYEVQWRRNNSDWVNAPRTGTTRLEVTDIYAGAYLCRVRAVNAAGATSLWVSATETQLDGIIAPPPVVTNLSATSLVFGIELKWGMPPGPSIIERTEIWYSRTSSRADAIKLGDYAYPQDNHTMMGLSAGARFYFWARLVDKNGQAGDWYPAEEGVLGTASADADLILDYLKDQIEDTQLAQTLRSRIETGEQAAVDVGAVTNDLAAMYTIKTQLMSDGRPYMAGIGVGVENNSGTITSQVLLSAQRVAILDESSGQLKTPFVVQGGQTFMNQALIGTAWINTANIADAAITTAKIGSLAVTNANIANGAINSAKIGDAEITTAKIGYAQIGSAQIAGNSVTVGAASQFETNIGVTSGIDTFLVPINLSQDGWIVGLFSATVIYHTGMWVVLSASTGWSKTFYYRAPTVDLDTGTVTGPPEIPCVFYSAGLVGAGQHWIKAQLVRPYNSTYTVNGSLAIFAGMR
ncbi:host specificity protein J [Bordetella sp. LUAb4]|uniref:host specificity protein J n=1 Tax=Bordetella sp. LUAb4 TaxID=2843195 RepID=UPI001E3DD15E|nr:phage tail protein [Bordetella sp. LUAb4]